MNEDTEFSYKIRQTLNQGLDGLNKKVAGRLHQARQSALNSQQVPTTGLRLAGFGDTVEHAFFSNAGALLAILALTIGTTGTNYWTAFQQAKEFEEIDSALLADELPPSAYLDRGFNAWLEHASDSSSQ